MAVLKPPALCLMGESLANRFLSLPCEFVS